MPKNIWDVLRNYDYLVLDTETTGLGSDAEICQIAIINAQGDTLMDRLIKPTRKIPLEAEGIHGISNEDVEYSPTIKAVLPRLIEITAGRQIVIYNAEYDTRVLNQSLGAHGIRPLELSTWCAMETFAAIYGDWNSYRHSYRWQKLSTAALFYDLPVIDAHSALGDCLMTLSVCKAMLTQHDQEHD